DLTLKFKFLKYIMPYKRKKYHVGDTHLKKRWRVRNRKKDLDEIDVDLKEENAEKLLNQDVNLDIPGAAQHYCLHCARYFIEERALSEHFKTKVHKRRLKALELEPYSIEESERAGGYGSFKLPTKRKIFTQNSDKQDITDRDDEVLKDSPNKRKKTDENDA
ncbi:jg27315, partial [Pararge aegeria aegeria]